MAIDVSWWIHPISPPWPQARFTGLASGAHAMQTFPNVYSVAVPRCGGVEWEAKNYPDPPSTIKYLGKLDNIYIYRLSINLVGGLEHVSFFHILGIVIPAD